MRYVSIAAGFLSLCWNMSSFGQQSSSCTGPQLGTWRLQSFKTRYLDNGETTEPFGAHPTGYLSYGRDCRMYAILAEEKRKLPAGAVPSDAEKIALFTGFVAYAGTYTIEGDQVTHHVDVSWNEAWTGTGQVRRFRIAGKVLYIESVPAKNFRDGRLSSSSLVWIKVE
jgi:hypothetical protein